MTPTSASTQIRSARLQRNLFAGISLMATVALAAQSVHMARSTNQVVLVPSSVSDGMVASGAVDVPYLEALAKDVVLALYQTSPNTVDYGRKVLERMAAPGSRAELLASYEETAKDIVARKVSTVFRITELATDLDGLTVAVHGQFDTFVRNNPAKSEARTVLVSFGRQGASARIIGVEAREVRS